MCSSRRQFSSTAAENLFLLSLTERNIFFYETQNITSAARYHGRWNQGPLVWLFSLQKAIRSKKENPSFKISVSSWDFCLIGHLAIFGFYCFWLRKACCVHWENKAKKTNRSTSLHLLSHIIPYMTYTEGDGWFKKRSGWCVLAADNFLLLQRWFLKYSPSAAKYFRSLSMHTHGRNVHWNSIFKRIISLRKHLLRGCSWVFESLPVVVNMSFFVSF